MLTSEIIQQLNEAEACSEFPILDVNYPVAARMSAYRDEMDWALVIETLEFLPLNAGVGHECISTEIYCFGSSLPQVPGRRYYPSLFVTRDGPGGPLFDPDDPMSQLISPSATDMTIRDKVVPITTDPARYAEAGIELKQSPRILGYELLRLIAPRYRRLFFATETEIVERIGKEMPLLLRLDEWRHPDPSPPPWMGMTGDELMRLNEWQQPDSLDELPGMSETFHMIAEVIANNDPSLYQPTEPPNTHWSNWPNAGEI